MNLLEIKNLSFEFEQHQVLQSLELNLARNEILCLLGASGCGKTTLLKVIAGLLPLSQGSIMLAGRNIIATPIEQRKIGLIFQDYALFPHLTVAENIRFGLNRCDCGRKDEVIERMLKVVKLQDFAHRFPHELSGGQQQRVAIARALACKPNLLLLDEPFSNIDTQTRYEMIHEIKQILKEENVPAIFVTHSKEEAFAFADKIAVMDQGKILQVGTPEELYHHPINPFVADFLGGTNYLDVEVDDNQRFLSPIGVCTICQQQRQQEGKYKWLLRPEQIQLVPFATGKGTIVDKLFLGQQYFYHIEIDGIVLTAFQSNNLPVGSRVSMQALCSDFVLFRTE